MGHRTRYMKTQSPWVGRRPKYVPSVTPSTTAATPAHTYQRVYQAGPRGGGGAKGPPATGSAALYQLARRGVRVLGLERFRPGNERWSSHW
jgi:hypothetical protein